MSEVDRQKWDLRYGMGDYQPRLEPAPFLLESLGNFDVGRALVLACGAGRNALALAAAGFEVHAVDVSAVAIDMARSEATRRGLNVNFQVADLDALALDDPLIGGGEFDLITTFRYMNRPLWPRMVRALAPDGWIIMEMHLQTSLDAAGPPAGPFRVEPNELLEAFGELRIMQYSETVEPDDRGGERMAVLARLLAAAGKVGW